MYLSEDLFEESIRNNFAGWYIESELYNHIDFILKETQIPHGSKVLDVACGHGRHTELLVKKGYYVKGIDISYTLINYLNNKYKDKIQFEKVAMEDMRCESQYDLVMILGNSLSLVPFENAKRAIINFHRALKKSGKLFIEIDNRNYYINNEAGKREWGFHGDRWLLFSEHLYNESSFCEISRDISIDLLEDTTKEHLLVKRLYDLNEISDIIKSKGFTNIKIYGDWEGTSIDEKSSKIIIIAEKQSQ